MIWYQVLFLLGFLIAIILLAVASLQVAELDKKVEQFSAELLERYAKPLASLNEAEEPKSNPPKS